jgi:hypothetical protein
VSSGAPAEIKGKAQRFQMPISLITCGAGVRPRPETVSQEERAEFGSDSHRPFSTNVKPQSEPRRGALWAGSGRLPRMCAPEFLDWRSLKESYHFHLAHPIPIQEPNTGW